MLTKMIVSSYEVLIEFALWIFLLICLVAGWKIGSGFFGASAGFVGAIGGLAIGFVFAVMFFGAFLVLHDIRKSVRVIESKHIS